MLNFRTILNKKLKEIKTNNCVLNVLLFELSYRLSSRDDECKNE